jgi:hypothetical protein
MMAPRDLEKLQASMKTDPRTGREACLPEHGLYGDQDGQDRLERHFQT